jgi:Raf kinase inhibitor-like YbhB/YbcL family protein
MRTSWVVVAGASAIAIALTAAPNAATRAGATPSLVQQTPPAQTPTPAPTPQPQRGGGQRGGGRRGPVQVMSLTTTAFADGAAIPVKHSQAGDVSPALAWTDPPAGTVSFVLIVHDVDAVSSSGADDLLQWMVWNIPAAARKLDEGVPQGPQLPDGARQISATGPNYRGPAAPASGPPHHYLFDLYALDTAIDVPAVGASPPQTRAAVVAAMANHIVGKATLVGTFRR